MKYPDDSGRGHEIFGFNLYPVIEDHNYFPPVGELSGGLASILSKCFTRVIFRKEQKAVDMHPTNCIELTLGLREYSKL